MIGAERQFVHAPETCQRLPEMALLAGACLSYAAATLPPRSRLSPPASGIVAPDQHPAGCGVSWRAALFRALSRSRRGFAKKPRPRRSYRPASISRAAAPAGGVAHSAGLGRLPLLPELAKTRVLLHIRLFRAVFGSRANLVAENLPLRQQLTVLGPPT